MKHPIFKSRSLLCSTLTLSIFGSLTCSTQLLASSVEDYQDQLSTSNSLETPVSEDEYEQEIFSSALETQKVEAPKNENFFQILREYHQYKKTHREEVNAFKQNFRTLKKELRNPDSAIATALRYTHEVCKTNPEKCHDAFATFVQPESEKIMNPPSTEAWLDRFFPKAYAADSSGIFFDTCLDESEVSGNPKDPVATHLFLIGSQNLSECDHGHNLRFQTYGPGLFMGRAALFITCTSDGNSGKNIGLTAGAGVVFGGQVGIFVGSNGVCTTLGVNQGVGAYAGVSILTVRHTSK